MIDAGYPIDDVTLDLVIDDLSRERLIAAEMITAVVSRNSILDPWISDLGRQLLAWTWAFE